MRGVRLCPEEYVKKHWRQYALYKYLLYIRQGFFKG